MAVTINADTTNGLVLTPDTSGEIKLQAGGADIATVSSTGLAMASGKGLSGDASSLTNIPAANLTGSLPAGMGGKVLQVLQATKTDSFTTTSTSYVTPTGLSISITPSSTSSKILVIPSIDFGISGDAGHAYARIYRGATSIFEASAAGGRNLTTFAQNNSGGNGGRCQTTTYIDSPSTTSAITYTIQVKSSNGTTLFVNRSPRDADAGTYDARTVSSITVMEIAG